MLTPSLAQEVAAETAAVTSLGILITDTRGIVIGSSDPARVGTFHEASVEVVRSRQSASHTAEQAHALEGVRPGMTLPIMVDGEAVGTVGITGAPARVRRFGPVVRRHTEILLRESVSLRTHLLRERAVEDLVAEIGAADPGLSNARLVLARARELGYQLETWRVVALIEVSPRPTEPSASTLDLSVMRTDLVRTVRDRFTGPQDIVAATAAGRIAVLHRLGRRPTAEDERTVAAECRRVVREIGVRHARTARAAIGGEAESVAGLRAALQDASDVLALGTRLEPAEEVYRISELRRYQLLSGVGQPARARLVDVELAALRSQSDWPELRRTLMAWCESGFNLVAAASALHVHRNTLIYRIAKIEQLSSRSLRDYPGSLTMYLACLADRLDDA